MIKDFEEFKKEVLINYHDFFYGKDDDGTSARRFCELIYSVGYSPTEKIVDFLFSLFCNKEDYEVMESVVQQLWSMKNKILFTKCLLKAFPRLAEEAPIWAEDFLYGIVQNGDIISFVLQISDIAGKKAIIDYIKELEKHLNADTTASSIDLKDLEIFHEFKNKLEASLFI